MKIGVIQASSQAGKNRLMYEAVERYATGFEVVNFGCFPGEEIQYSYIEISVAIGLLLGSRAVDFIVTGCSSGQGMMLACNSMPGVICGYAPTPKDAYLFAQINNGNAVSLPLGEDYTYSGDENLQKTACLLFSEPFGRGYPKEEADRKIRDAEMLKSIRKKSQTDLITLLDGLETPFIRKVLGKKNVIGYILASSPDSPISAWIQKRL